jgi:hypothetical protein
MNDIMMDNNLIKAQKRVKAKKGFYSHLGSFIAVNAFLFALNAVTYSGSWWFVFPTLGWSIGLVTHYFSVFGMPWLEHDWEDKEMEREIKRLERGGPRSRGKDEEDTLELKRLQKQSRKNWEEEDLV